MIPSHDPRWKLSTESHLVVLDEEALEALSPEDRQHWKGYWYKMTYETWDEEALEAGDTDDKGWVTQKSESYDSLDELLHSVGGYANWVEWSDSRPTARSWVTSEGEQNVAGENTQNSLWVMRGDGKPLGREEIVHITFTFKLHH